MVDIERAHGIPVEEELHPGRVRADAHVHRLPGIEVPVGEYVHERRLVVVRPFRAEHIRAVLGEPGGVVLPEVAVLGGIRRWLTDVVESRPDELPGAEFRVPVPDYALLGILRAPAGAAVAQGGALLVIVRQHRLRQGEVVYTTALHDGSGFAAIDEPVRVLLVVLAGAVQLDVTSVEEESVVGGELHRAESEAAGSALYHVAAAYQLGYCIIKVRVVDIPPSGGIHPDNLPREGIRRARLPYRRRNAGYVRRAGVALGARHGIPLPVEKRGAHAEPGNRSALRADDLRLHRKFPAALHGLCGEVHAVVAKVDIRVFTQPYIAENTGAGIPPGVRGAVVYPDGDDILAVPYQRGNIVLERRVAVLPLPCLLAVYIHGAVHIHAVKPYRSAYSRLPAVGEPLPVPAGGGGIQVVGVPYQPVVWKVHGGEI